MQEIQPREKSKKRMRATAATVGLLIAGIVVAGALLAGAFFHASGYATNNLVPAYAGK